MTLRRSLLAASLLAASLVALIGTLAIETLRAEDRRVLLERASEAAVVDNQREACEANPNWFLAGPREGRPTKEEQAQPDADVYTKRPDVKPRPFEYFAFDEEFRGISTAAPRFPEAFRSALKSGDPVASETWSGPDGTGVEVARWTGWRGSECAILLFRAAPPPHQWRQRAEIFVGLFGAVLVALLVVSTPVERRIAAVSAKMRESSRSDYASVAPAAGNDEITAIGALFNDAAGHIRQRAVEVREQQAAIRRIADETDADVVAPLSQVPAHIDDVLRSVSLTASVKEQLLGTLWHAQTVALHGANLVASARLRDRDAELRNGPVDLTQCIERVASRYAVSAHARGITLRASVPDAVVNVNGDAAMFDLALANLVDNAIRYNKPGGEVDINLDAPSPGAFVLTVSDSGAGMNDALLKYVNGIRRFRGDERRKHRQDEVGLGLAVVHEVTGRARIALSFRRRDNGGIEVKWSRTAG